jgi:PEGA domain
MTLRTETGAMAMCALFLCSSCATLFQGNKEEVMVNSNPAGAQVVVNDGRSGTTPYSIRVGRDDDLQIHVSKIGYSSTDITDTSHMEWGYFIADFFFTGLIGLAIDGLDGAMFYHDQTMVAAHLDALLPVSYPAALTTIPTPIVKPAPAYPPDPDM